MRFLTSRFSCEMGNVFLTPSSLPSPPPLFLSQYFSLTFFLFFAYWPKRACAAGKMTVTRRRLTESMVGDWRPWALPLWVNPAPLTEQIATFSHLISANYPGCHFPWWGWPRMRPVPHTSRLERTCTKSVLSSLRAVGNDFECRDGGVEGEWKKIAKQVLSLTVW